MRNTKVLLFVYCCKEMTSKPAFQAKKCRFIWLYRKNIVTLHDFSRGVGSLEPWYVVDCAVDEGIEWGEYGGNKKGENRQGRDVGRSEQKITKIKIKCQRFVKLQAREP